MIGLLGSLLGGRGGRMLGGMIGGRHGAMVGGLLGSLVGGRRLGGALGGLKDKIGGGGGSESNLAGDDQPLSDEDAVLLIRSMANAAKSDGHVDQSEIDAILGELGEISSEEQQFLSNELSSPMVPPADLAASVPKGLVVEAYVVSVGAITVDSSAEKTYLTGLAEALGIDENARKAIHDELGLPHID